MAFLTHTYSPDQIVINFGGFTITGFEDGEFINVVMPDLYTKSTGADGEVTRVKNVDKSAEVTLTLLQDSVSNAVLSDLAQQDEDTPGGAGVVPLTIRNLNGTTVLQASSAWIAKRPDVGFAKGEQTAREWTIHCQNVSYAG